MKILLTGATGFIGTHLLEELIHKKFEVTALVRDKSKFKFAMPTEIIEIDLINGEFEKIHGKWDVLIHLADIMPGKNSKSFIENCIICSNLIEKIINKGFVKKIIYTNTIDVYGHPHYLPIDENHPIEPVTSYGATKACNEILLSTELRKKQIPLIILRLSQVYGPGDAPLKAIPIFIEKIKSDDPITIYGDGTDKRDYIYVRDVIRVILLALYSEKTGIYNVATGTGHTLIDVIKTIERLIGRKLNLLFESRKKARTEIILDISKITTDFNFTPKYNLKDGLSEYLRSEGCLTQ